MAQGRLFNALVEPPTTAAGVPTKSLQSGATTPSSVDRNEGKLIATLARNHERNGPGSRCHPTGAAPAYLLRHCLQATPQASAGGRLTCAPRPLVAPMVQQETVSSPSLALFRRSAVAYSPKESSAFHPKGCRRKEKITKEGSGVKACSILIAIY